jgi:hypothetical protein
MDLPILDDAKLQVRSRGGRLYWLPIHNDALPPNIGCTNKALHLLRNRSRFAVRDQTTPHAVNSLDRFKQPIAKLH